MLSYATMTTMYSDKNDCMFNFKLLTYSLRGQFSELDGPFGRLGAKAPPVSVLKDALIVLKIIRFFGLCCFIEAHNRSTG